MNEADKLHTMGSFTSMDETQNILNEVKLYFQNSTEGRYGKVKDTDFEWMIDKLERSIQFSYKTLT